MRSARWLVGAAGTLVAMVISLGSAGAVRAAGPPLPSKATQIAELARAAAYMHAHYEQLNLYWEPGPADVFDYGINTLWRHGVDGAGTTVALLEGWNAPTATILAQEDRALKLPPTQVSTLDLDGALPRHCPAGMQRLANYGSCAGWEGELALDLTAVHLIAPYAHILLVVTPASVQADAAEDVAPPEMMASVEDISDHHLANVISVSDGTGETTYRHGLEEILAQDPGELTAAADGVPFVAATGDCGAAQALPMSQGMGCEHVTHFRSSATWDDSPWVTAVGGSLPNLNSNDGRRLGPDSLWHVYLQSHRTPFFGESAGAGLSAVFARPSYQGEVASITHSSQRSVPDITMDAMDGTSEAAPLLAGVLALATQENGGRDLGPINPALYALGPQGAAAGISDVIGGSDNTRDPFTGQIWARGYTATRGFDIASGWGTVYAPVFVPRLVAETRRLRGEAAARLAARAQLRELERGAVTATFAPGGRTMTVRLGDLLPDYPFSVTDGRRVLARGVTGPSGGAVVTLRLSGAVPRAVTLHSLLITWRAPVISEAASIVDRLLRWSGVS